MKNNYILLILIALISIPLSSRSQQWSIQLGGGWDDGSFTSVSSSNGHTLIAGKFTGSNLITPIDTLVETNHGDLFLTRIDPNGNCLWVKQIYCTFPDTSNPSGPYAIALDEINQVIYVAFHVKGRIDVDTFTSLSFGGDDIVLAKFDYSGNCIWLKGAGGFWDDIATGLALDSVGEIYICGQSNSGATFDSITLTSDGSFLAKYSSNGNCLWAKTISSYGFRAYFIECNNSRLIMTGINYLDTINIDTLNLIHSSGYQSIVIAGFNLSGNIIWVKEALSRLNNNGISDLSLDGEGNIYAGGYFRDTLNMEWNLLISNIGESAMFLIKLSPTGNLIWNKQINSIYSNINSICSSTYGNLYITGRLGDTANFGNIEIIPNYPMEMFLVHYDSSGNFNGVIHYGEALGTSVSQDGNETPYVVTAFYNTVNNGIASYTSYGGSDILITRYDILDNIQNPERIGSGQLLIYANPNSGKCKIQIPEELQKDSELDLKIYSASGTILQNRIVRLNSETISLDLEYEAAGIYLVTLSNGQKIYRGKIVFE
jgi:hypothetical protein